MQNKMGVEDMATAVFVLKNVHLAAEVYNIFRST
jgi:hypothetical protein